MAADTSPRWTLAAYETGDEVAICELMRFATPIGLDPQTHLQTWRWRFLESPVSEIFVDLAWDADKLVGQYAVQPIRMQVDGRKALWCISLDTVTHTEYRRQGIFTTLTSHLYERIADRVEVVYGFPNEESSAGFYGRLGWTVLEPHPKLVRIGELPGRARSHPLLRVASPLLGGAVAALATPVRLGLLAARTTGFEVIVDDRAPKDTDDLWQRVAEQSGIRVLSDRLWFEWRYDRHPTFEYRYVAIRRKGRLEGLAVIRPPQAGQENRFGYLMDFMIGDASKRRLTAITAMAALDALQRNGARSIWALAPVGSTLRRTLRALGCIPFRETSEAWQWTLGARVLADRMGAAEIFEPSQWHVGYGVHDMV
jgi:GNAT superfamily N-acetyltransferase